MAVLADIICTAVLESIDNTNHCNDLVARLGGPPNGVNHGLASRHDVVHDNDTAPGRWRILDPRLRAVLLGFLAHVERLKPHAAFETSHHDGADDRIGTHGQAANAIDPWKLCEFLQVRVGQQRRAVWVHRDALAVEVVV